MHTFLLILGILVGALVLVGGLAFAALVLPWIISGGR